MKPEDVPADLLEVAVEMLNDDAHENCSDEEGCPGNVRPFFEEQMRGVLADILPEHEKQIRAKVAEEIQETIDADVPGQLEEGLALAASIARGGS